MTPHLRRVAVLGVVAAIAVWACTDDLTAPGQCDNFCPSEKITVRDTVLDTAITRDSAYGRPVGYINPHKAPVMLVESLPGVRTSRAIFRFNPAQVLRKAITSTDTTTGPLLQPDSVFVAVRILRHDAHATNLTVHLYRMPLAMDSTTTFSDPAVSDSFATALLRSVNIDTLRARPTRRDSIIALDTVHIDTITGDRLAVDSVGGQEQFVLIFKLDSLAVPFDTTDSARAAFGIRVTADSFASIAVGTSDLGQGPRLTWFNRFDSLGTIVGFRQSAQGGTAGAGAFDGFVFTPPPTGLDSNLTVGGMPEARSVLRVKLPRAIVDSTQIVRATLLLIPSDSVRGIPSDSFGLLVHATLLDVGAKSPTLLDPTLPPDSTIIRVGLTDTVRIDVTKVLRRWQVDTLMPRTLILQQGVFISGLLYNGAEFAEGRFYSSRAALHRPRLHITYIPRITFSP